MLGDQVSFVTKVPTGPVGQAAINEVRRFRDAYKALEAESVDSMTRLLPPELAEEVSPFITGSLLTAEENRLLKAADRLSALIKCMEEQRSGNHEFDAALRQQREALEGMHCPEADWFMAHCLPCFTQNLDELTRSE